MAGRNDPPPRLPYSQQMQQPPSQPRAYSQAAGMPNGASFSGPVPGARPLEPNQGRVQQIGHARVLCIADVRGNLRQLNELARNAKADYVIHTGDFGFYDNTSLDRIAEKTLKHVAQYSPLLPEPVKADISRAGPQASVKDRFQRERLPLSELPQFLSGQFKLEVPVFSVWGACEDVAVLEKLRSGEYKIDNLQVIDESHSRFLDVGGVKLRLLGLGGAVVMHKLFDNGEGRTTIAGGQGTMWTTLLQMGELIDTANRVYDPSETRVLVTHASPAREGLLNQLSVSLKADFSISAGLHFRYGSSYNEFSVNPSLDHYRGKLAASKASFNDVWETVRQEVEPAIADNPSQSKLLELARGLVSKMPHVANGGNPFGGGPQSGGQVDESAFKNMWNFNLADAAFGWLVLDIDQGRIGTEMRAQGFNFSHRSNKVQQRHQGVPAEQQQAVTGQAGGNLPTTGSQPPPMAQQQARPPPQGPAQPQAPVNQAPPQQRAQQPMAAQQLQQTAQPKPVQQQQPTPNQPVQKPAAPGASPAASPGPALTANGTTAPTANLPQTNGTAPSTSETPKPAEGNNQRNNFQTQPQSTGIFITGTTSLQSSEEIKNQLFSEEDAAKIVKTERTPKGPFVVHFSSPEIMQEVLSRNPTSEVKEKFSGVRMNPFRTPRGYGGAGNWGSSRGGMNMRGGGEGGRGGYQSASGATTGSDSEGGRGGRGGRGRGGFRGERGGRGRGGGRGGQNKAEGTPSGTPAPATGAGEA
ncbi:hypothetical protein MBLNU230_g6373t1 [Neophaeotheca triangularis]